MSNPVRDPRLDTFENAFRIWGRRDAPTSPGRAASTLRARLETPHRGYPVLRLAAAAALLLAIGILAYLTPPSAVPLPSRVAAQEPQPLGDGRIGNSFVLCRGRSKLPPLKRTLRYGGNIANDLHVEKHGHNRVVRHSS